VPAAAGGSAWDDTPRVSVFDVILVLLLLLTGFSGYRRGAVLQVLGLAGVVAGLILAIVIGPSLADLAEDPLARVLIALAIVVLAATAGNAIGYVIGSRLRRGLPPRGTATSADAAAGAGLAVLSLLVGTWFVALNLANGPFPTIARQIRDSSIVRTMANSLPAPPPLVPQLERFADAFGFPDVFIGLPSSAEPVPPPNDAAVQAAFAAAAPSTMQVLGAGCTEGYLNEGSGFVAAPGYVVTNAHVVAGVREPWVQGADGRYEATTVVFDPDLDIAVLHVPGLDAPPLPLAIEHLDRGVGGAALGYPGGGRLTTVPAAVRRLFEPLGRDIYGRGEVQRLLYELDAVVRQGNSGGPFVLPSGRVAGVIVANSVLDENVGYAIAAEQVAPLIARATGQSAPTGVGACT